MSFIWFLNSIPAILIFFLRFAVHQDEDEAKSAYTYCLITFIFIGMCALLVISKIIAKKGKLFASGIALWGLFFAGIAMFIVSYLNVILVIIVFGSVGFFSTMCNTVYNILAADCVDYDELLTGMKRASSYTSVTNLPYMFITIAGSSLPLALMSSLGFEEPADDDEANDDGYSTKGSTLVIRIYCSCFVSLLAVLAMITLKFYKVNLRLSVRHSSSLFTLTLRSTVLLL
jgi:Na+/melibiose symporter-like transporter